MKFKDLPVRAHFKLAKDAAIGLDIVYIKYLQPNGQYNAYKLGEPMIPVMINPDFDVILS